MATPLVDKCEEVVGSASTSTSRCDSDSDSDYNCVKSQEHFEEDGDPPICRFCLSENVPAVVRDTTCRRSVWATDSFVQNAIVPTVKFVRRSLRRGAGRGKQEEERERAACKMLSPCDCKGSQKYVHDKCLMYWISQRISKGVSLERAHECPVCKQPYNLPRSFTGEKLQANLIFFGRLYFGSCFMMGGMRGIVAVSPLWLFPGLPLHVLTQVSEVRSTRHRGGLTFVQSFAFAYTNLSALVMLKGWCMGGICGSILGGKYLLKTVSRVLQQMCKKSDSQNN